MEKYRVLNSFTKAKQTLVPKQFQDHNINFDESIFKIDTLVTSVPSA